MKRILITGGTVIDGRARAKPLRRDLLVEGDRIREIAPSIRAPGARAIDAKGLIVAPGFIDAHSHSDTAALLDSSAEGRVYDGVTTEINGTCGYSLFPLEGPIREQRREALRARGIEADWIDAAGYFARLEAAESAVNRGFLVGHGALRGSVLGYAARPAGPAQQRRMEALLDAALEEGALGLSSGLCYPPGCFAATAELTGLCRRLARSGRPYCTHMRNEGRQLLRSVHEALRITGAAGAPLHISHVKTFGYRNWWKIDALERTLFAARARGHAVTCDRYPYLAAMTDLAALFPDWLMAGGKDSALARLRRRAARARLRRVVERGPTKARWDAVQISVATADTRAFEGLTVTDAAARLNLDPVDAVFELLLRTRLAISAIFFEMSEENLRRIFGWPFVYVGSDSSSRATTGPTAEGRPHPRTFGSCARFLGEYVRRQGLLSLPEGIARMTGLPAERFGLKDRGILRPGAFADITLFDPRQVRDTATYLQPFSLSEGIRHVLVNGTPVLIGGKQTAHRPGRVLRYGD